LELNPISINAEEGEGTQRSAEKTRDDKKFKKILLCVPQQPLRLSVRIEP
jgi:hypothetical protein